MTQYAITDLDFRVLGFVDDERMPVLPPDRISHVMIPRVAFFPKASSPTEVLHIANGEVYWVETAALADLKAHKNDEINAARLAANRSYFDFAGKQIACDEVSMLDIQSANAEIALTREMPLSWPGAWKAKDNTYVLLPDVAAWTAFIRAMVSRGTAHFQRAQALKGQLAAASTAEEIAAINWQSESTTQPLENP